MNTNKKRVTIKDNDQDTLADLDADDYMFDNLLEDEKENLNKPYIIIYQIFIPYKI